MPRFKDLSIFSQEIQDFGDRGKFSVAKNVIYTGMYFLLGYQKFQVS